MLINSAYRPYIESSKRINVVWGSAGSGKSYTVAQNKVKKCISNPYFKCVTLRKNAVTLKDSVYALIQKVIFEENLQDQFKFTTSPLSIKHLPTGNEFIFRGMLNEVDREKIKSIVDPTDAWLEEANEFDKEDFQQINLRVRGANETVKQIDLTFNPVDEELWLKDRFFDNPPDKEDIFTLNTTYKDNKFLDKPYTEALEKLINEDDNLYKVYVLGQWGSIDNRGRIYKRFIDEEFPNGSIAKHDYIPQLPIIVCCDFNVDPMKWALIQNVNGVDYVFDEIVKQDTDTEQMTKELINRYGVLPYIVYGDASGTFRHTSAKATDYQIMKQYLPSMQMNVKQANPPVTDRINAVNWRLQNKEGKRRLFVDPKCKNAIYDFKRATFKEGTREEDKSLERYDGKNPVMSLIHITSAIGYYIEYEYSLKGKPRVRISDAI